MSADASSLGSGVWSDITEWMAAGLGRDVCKLLMFYYVFFSSFHNLKTNTVYSTYSPLTQSLSFYLDRCMCVCACVLCPQAGIGYWVMSLKREEPFHLPSGSNPSDTWHPFTSCRLTCTHTQPIKPPTCACLNMGDTTCQRKLSMKKYLIFICLKKSLTDTWATSQTSKCDSHIKKIRMTCFEHSLKGLQIC